MQIQLLLIGQNNRFFDKTIFSMEPFVIIKYVPVSAVIIASSCMGAGNFRCSNATYMVIRTDPEIEIVSL